ncbi:MAG: NTP transferase domain-containing protein [Nitrosopumilus sp.]|nr:NTP transferase domain-containing protein [Nitrosopumilus sp.]MDH3825119.1 NTP transferase domain-containing protein [Nitrosopumilus sp.]
MIGIVMAGGKGSRMKLAEEKLLLQFKKPLILQVAEAMTDSGCFSKIIFVTSPNSPKTKQLLQKNNYEIFDTPGIGYVEDLNTILKSLNDSVFIVSADLPLLDGEIIKKIVKFYNPNYLWTTILVTKNFLNSLGLSSDYDITFENKICNYTGISMINSQRVNNLENIEEKFVIVDDKRIGFNVNTNQDYNLLGTT